MAGKRMIHDRICESRKVNSVDFYAEALWVRIITKADDNGNFWRKPSKVHNICMDEKPGGSEKLTTKALGALIEAGLLLVYPADGREYVHVANFHEFQELPTDRYAQVQFPVHPAYMGGAYLGSGLRRSVWVEKEDRSKQELRTEESRRTPEEVTEESRSESGKSADQGKGKGQVEGKGNGTEPDLSGNFKAFGIRFSQITGVTLSGAKQVKEQVNEFLDCCPYEVAVEALEEWVRQRGGRDRVKEKPQYAWKNFHEAYESIIAGLRAPAAAESSFPVNPIPD